MYKNPLAVFCTHGHFDHVYDCDAIKAKFGVDIYIPKDDAFLCQNDPFGLLQAKFNPDILVSDGEEFDFSGVKFAFCHFPGHTPGCSVITAGDVMFSGDFIFKNSIGRYDFPFSDGKLMKQSLKRAVELKNYKIYPKNSSLWNNISTQEADEKLKTIGRFVSNNFGFRED